MKRSTKAALLSGLIFPGIGHIALKQYLRGSILVIVALGAMSVIVKVAFQRAQAIVDSVVDGDIPIESGAIIELLSNSSDGSVSTAVTACTILFGACWLIGIIDSYRVGATLDKIDENYV